MLSKVIVIDGREVEFKASASTPRLYRFKFRRDMMIDMKKLSDSYTENQKEGKEFELMDLEIFENVAYIMAKQADESIAADIGSWLDDFNVFSIYEVLPEILELWGINIESQIESKKNFQQVAGK